MNNIINGESGSSVRTKLNELIDEYNNLGEIVILHENVTPNANLLETGDAYDENTYVDLANLLGPTPHPFLSEEITKIVRVDDTVFIVSLAGENPLYITNNNGQTYQVLEETKYNIRDFVIMNMMGYLAIYLNNGEYFNKKGTGNFFLYINNNGVYELHQSMGYLPFTWAFGLDENIDINEKTAVDFNLLLMIGITSTQNNSYIQYSLDDGASWTQNNIASGVLQDLKALGDLQNGTLTMIVVGDTFLKISTNFGSSWTDLSSNINGTLNSISGIDHENWIVGGVDLLLTNDAGSSFTNLTSNITAEVTKVDMLSVNEFIVTTPNEVLYTTNGGSTFTDIKSNMNNDNSQSILLDTGVILASVLNTPTPNISDLEISTDGGLTFTDLEEPLGYIVPKFNVNKPYKSYMIATK